MGLMADWNTFSRAISTWVQCPCSWDGHWKGLFQKITRYWSNSSRIGWSRR